MDFDPFNKAVNQAKTYIQEYNSPANRAIRSNPYYRQQQQLKSQMQDRLRGITDPAQRSSIQSQYRQRIGGALQRAKSMGYDPSGNYNQNNLQRYYGQNGSSVQQLARRNDQGYLKNVGQSMAGATYKAGVDTLLMPLHMYALGTAAGNWMAGNGFKQDQGVSNFVQRARRWDSAFSPDGKSTYDTATQMQGPMSDRQRAIQQLATGAALWGGASKLVSGTGKLLDVTGKGVSAVGRAAKATGQGISKGTKAVINAPQQVLSKGKQVVNNIGQAQKQWAKFRTDANFIRNRAARVRAARNLDLKSHAIRDVHTSQKGTLGKTWDLITNPKAAVKQAWQHGKWQDRFWHPLKNTKQWWRYSNSSLRHPIQNLKNSFGYTTDAYKYISQGKGFADKAKRFGTVGLDAGKKAGKFGVDAALSQGVRIGIDDYYNKQLQQTYADTNLSQEQRVDRLNALQRRRRGFKTALGVISAKYGLTPMSKLVGSQMQLEGGAMPALSSGIESVAVNGWSPIAAVENYWHPYAVKGKQNMFQAGRQMALRYGDTSMFNHFLQRAGGDLLQTAYYNKLGAIPSMALQYGTTLKYGAGANPVQWSDRSNVQRVNQNVLPLVMRSTGLQNRIAQIKNNENLSDQQKQELIKPLQAMAEPYRQAIVERGQATNKGRVLDAAVQAATGQPISDQNMYVAATQLGASIPGSYLLRTFAQPEINKQIQNNKVLSTAIIAQKDPAKRAQLIKKLNYQMYSPMTQAAILQGMYRDPQQAIRRGFQKNNITSSDMKQMAVAQQLAQQTNKITDKNGGSAYSRSLVKQYGLQGATARYADLVQKAAQQGDPQKFKTLASDALWLMNQMGQGAGGSQQAARLKRAFKSNMWTMIKKDPSLLPVAMGLYLGGSGAPGLGNFIAQNPILSIGGVAALFALPSLIGGARQLFAGMGKATGGTSQVPAQRMPQTDLYATTLRRRG